MKSADVVMKGIRVSVKASLRVIEGACCHFPDSMKSGVPAISIELVSQIISTLSGFGVSAIGSSAPPEGSLFEMASTSLNVAAFVKLPLEAITERTAVWVRASAAMKCVLMAAAAQSTTVISVSLYCVGVLSISLPVGEFRLPSHLCVATEKMLPTRSVKEDGMRGDEDEELSAALLFERCERKRLLHRVVNDRQELRVLLRQRE
jgi:hypothetical protein